MPYKRPQYPKTVIKFSWIRNNTKPLSDNPAANPYFSAQVFHLQETQGRTPSYSYSESLSMNTIELRAYCDTKKINLPLTFSTNNGLLIDRINQAKNSNNLHDILSGFYYQFKNTDWHYHVTNEPLDKRLSEGTAGETPVALKELLDHLELKRQSRRRELTAKIKQARAQRAAKVIPPFTLESLKNIIDKADQLRDENFDNPANQKAAKETVIKLKTLYGSLIDQTPLIQNETLVTRIICALYTMNYDDHLKEDKQKQYDIYVKFRMDYCKDEKGFFRKTNIFKPSQGPKEYKKSLETFQSLFKGLFDYCGYILNPTIPIPIPSPLTALLETTRQVRGNTDAGGGGGSKNLPSHHQQEPDEPPAATTSQPPDEQPIQVVAAAASAQTPLLSSPQDPQKPGQPPRTSGRRSSLEMEDRKSTASLQKPVDKCCARLWAYCCRKNPPKVNWNDGNDYNTYGASGAPYGSMNR